MRLKLVILSLIYEVSRVIYTAKIKLLRPWLGSVHDPSRKLRGCFRVQNNRVEIDGKAWDFIFQEAKDNLSLQCDTRLIVWPLDFLSPSRHFYRNYYNRLKFDDFEAFRKGTEITLDFSVKTDPMSPTKDDLIKLWENVGRYIGISDFGKKFGYGRFELLSLTTN